MGRMNRLEERWGRKEENARENTESGGKNYTKQGGIEGTTCDNAESEAMERESKGATIWRTDAETIPNRRAKREQTSENT